MGQTGEWGYEGGGLGAGVSTHHVDDLPESQSEGDVEGGRGVLRRTDSAVVSPHQGSQQVLLVVIADRHSD